MGVKRLNKAQFKLIAEKLKIKQERLQAIKDVIFTNTTATRTETKYGLHRGVIQRDVDRIKSIYTWAVNLIKTRASK